MSVAKYGLRSFCTHQRRIRSANRQIVSPSRKTKSIKTSTKKGRAKRSRRWSNQVPAFRMDQSKKWLMNKVTDLSLELIGSSRCYEKTVDIAKARLIMKAVGTSGVDGLRRYEIGAAVGFHHGGHSMNRVLRNLRMVEPPLLQHKVSDNKQTPYVLTPHAIECLEDM